jgi:Domain of unknown function DUF29
MTEPLYDTDFHAWTRQQAQALRAKEWSALDLDHLAEEIDDLGSHVEHAIESHLEHLLLHLLKLRHDPATRPCRGWKVTVDHARQEITKYLRRNPGLQHLPVRYLAEAYRIASRRAALAMDRPPADFPEVCPWDLAQVLDEDWWPGEA